MYYEDVNVYITNNIAFDLNQFDIYYLNENALYVFEELYKNVNNESLVKYKEYSDVCNTFFKSPKDKKNTAEIEQQRKIKVTSVMIKVSNTCNMKCKYCFAHQGNYGVKDSLMDKETAKKIGESIVKYFPDVERIGFFGGEPLLNLQAIKIIMDTIGRSDILYTIVTNMTIVNNTLIDLLKRYNLRITASIDGPEDINDLYRVSKSGKGSFNTISNNIKEIQELTGTIDMLEAVYTKPSYYKYSITDLLDYLYNTFGINHIGIGEVITDDKSMKLPDEYFASKYDNIANTIEYSIQKIMNKSFFAANELYNIIECFFGKIRTEQFCGAGLGSVFIDEYGNLIPCQMFYDKLEYSMGNIIQDGISDKFFAIQSKLASVKKSNIDNCKDCIASFWCFKCIGSIENYDIFCACKSNNSCRYNKKFTEITFEYLAKMALKDEIQKLTDNINEMTEIHYLKR